MIHRLNSTALRTHSTVGRLPAAFVLATALAVARGAEAATIVLNAVRQGDAIAIEASAQLRADAGTAWRVLTAYDRYPEFIPDLHTSRVVARRGNTVTVEQTGTARVWVFPLPLEITFEVAEYPPNGLRSHAISGTLNALESSYALTPAAWGVRLEYVGQVAPGFGFFGPLELQAVKANAARQFNALADEIERQSAAATP